MPQKKQKQGKRQRSKSKSSPKKSIPAVFLPKTAKTNINIAINSQGKAIKRVDDSDVGQNTDSTPQKEALLQKGNSSSKTINQKEMTEKVKTEVKNMVGATKKKTAIKSTKADDMKASKKENQHENNEDEDNNSERDLQENEAENDPVPDDNISDSSHEDEDEDLRVNNPIVVDKIIPTDEKNSETRPREQEKEQEQEQEKEQEQEQENDDEFISTLPTLADRRRRFVVVNTDKRRNNTQFSEYFQKHFSKKKLDAILQHSAGHLFLVFKKRTGPHSIAEKLHRVRVFGFPPTIKLQTKTIAVVQKAASYNLTVIHANYDRLRKKRIRVSKQVSSMSRSQTDCESAEDEDDEEDDEDSKLDAEPEKPKPKSRSKVTKNVGVSNPHRLLQVDAKEEDEIIQMLTHEILENLESCETLLLKFKSESPFPFKKFHVLQSNEKFFQGLVAVSLKGDTDGLYAQSIEKRLKKYALLSSEIQEKRKAIVQDIDKESLDDLNNKRMQLGANNEQDTRPNKEQKKDNTEPRMNVEQEKKKENVEPGMNVENEENKNDVEPGADTGNNEKKDDGTA